MKRIAQTILCYSLMFSTNSVAEQTLHVSPVEQAPVIDGKADEIEWSTVPAITTIDRIANIPIQLQAVTSGITLFIKVRFPDETENRAHKNLVWDHDLEMYRAGPKREDFFVFKWNMNPHATDLSLSGEQSYKADIWYWKAFRTDHAGYADDKFHIYSETPSTRSKRLINKNGKSYYLARRGDAGSAAYRGRQLTEYTDDDVYSLEHQLPSGSRSDVRAKGQWSDGYWTIEFARALNTGNPDDVVISKGTVLQFGVSRYEIAGRKPDPSLEQPLAGSGDIGETLFLNLK
ncbi:MAG: hypothetical protein HOD11_12075 [Candidatus Marinimicrobia bacterium]|nr:hypothetical protein [Candidatus Neomarinimicrobiota bacterium]